MDWVKFAEVQLNHTLDFKGDKTKPTLNNLRAGFTLSIASTYAPNFAAALIAIQFCIYLPVKQERLRSQIWRCPSLLTLEKC